MPKKTIIVAAVVTVGILFLRARSVTFRKALGEAA